MWDSLWLINAYAIFIFSSINGSSDVQFWFIINLHQLRSGKSLKFEIFAKLLIHFSTDIKVITAAKPNDARFANKFRELITFCLIKNLSWKCFLFNWIFERCCWLFQKKFDGWHGKPNLHSTVHNFNIRWNEIKTNIVTLNPTLTIIYHWVFEIISECEKAFQFQVYFIFEMLQTRSSSTAINNICFCFSHSSPLSLSLSPSSPVKYSVKNE